MIFPVAMPFIQKFWKPIAIIASVLIIFGYGYYKGYQNQKTKFDAFVTQIEANAKVQQEKNALILKNQEKITKNIVKGYSDAINKVNDYYVNHANRVQNNSTSRSMPDNGKTASAVNDPAQNIQDNATRVETAVIPQECVEDAINLFYLQKWITEQVDND